MSCLASYWLRRPRALVSNIITSCLHILFPQFKSYGQSLKTPPFREHSVICLILTVPPPPAKPHPVVALLLVPSSTQLNVAGDSHGHNDLSHWNSWSLTLWGFSAFPDNQTACPMSILSPVLPNLGSVTFSVKWWILNTFGFEGHHLYITTTQLCSLANQPLCQEPYMISSLASNFPCFLPPSYFQLNSYWNRTEKLEANRKQCPQTLPMRTRVHKPTFQVLWTHCFCFWWGQPSSSRTQGPFLGFLCISYFHSLLGCLNQYTNTMIFLCMCAKSFQLCPTLLWPMGCSLPGSSVHRDSPGKNTGVGCYALLQGIFLTQRSNPHFWSLLHWQTGSLPTEPPAQKYPITILCIKSLHNVIGQLYFKNKQNRRKRDQMYGS